MNPITELNDQRPLLELDYAVIGAGIAGLTAASELKRLGYSLAVFEKARGTGGRLSSKRVAYDNGQAMAFDLGCVSITGKSDAFIRQLQHWQQKGVIEPWWINNDNQTHYVAVSRNSGLTRYLSSGIESLFSTRVSSVKRINNVWHLYTEVGIKETLLATAKNVIIATPPAQAYDLLPPDSAFRQELAEVKVGAQWVMALEIDNDVSNLPAILYPNSDILFSISQENKKPGRKGESTVLQIQAQESWTSRHLEAPHESVSSALISALEDQLRSPLNIINAYVHRWLYSRIVKGISTPAGYLWDGHGLGLIGDYFNTEYDGVESSWLSGVQLIENIAAKK